MILWSTISVNMDLWAKLTEPKLLIHVEQIMSARRMRIVM